MPPVGRVVGPSWHPENKAQTIPLAKGNGVGPLDELIAIAADVAVDLEVGVLRDTGRTPPFVKPQRISEHPRHREFIKSLEEDPVLGKLFPDDDEQRGYIRTF